jgi:hypothetical protein
VDDVLFVRQAVTDPEVMTNLYAAFTTAGYVPHLFYVEYEKSICIERRF